MGDHRYGATSRQHLHSLMARRATPSFRLPSGSPIIPLAAELDESFTIPHLEIDPIKIDDIKTYTNVIVKDLYTGLEMSKFVNCKTTVLSDVVGDVLNDFIRAGVRGQLFAPGEKADPMQMVLDDGSEGNITTMDPTDGNEMMMPSGQLILQRNAAIQAAADEIPFDPVLSIEQAVNQVYSDALEAAKETSAQMMTDITEIRLNEVIENVVLPIANEKIQELVDSCNERIETAQAEARAIVQRAIESADKNRLQLAEEMTQSERLRTIQPCKARSTISPLDAQIEQFYTLSDKQMNWKNRMMSALSLRWMMTLTLIHLRSSQKGLYDWRTHYTDQIMIENVTGRIRTVLTMRCNIPEKVRAEFAISTIKEKLPEKLNGKPDPLVAEELTSFINKLIATYPEQLWSIVPTLHRLINMDHTENTKGDRWTPPTLKDCYTDVPYNLQPYYASHSQRLFDVLTIMGSQAVQRAMSSFSTGDDDVSLKRISQADHGDGVSVLAWHLHYHEQSGYQIRAELQNYLNYAHGAFVDKDPVEAVKAIRKKLREAERLGIKLEYDMSCRRIVEVIRRRDVSFVSPMQQWITCPDPTKQSDCISFMDPLLAEIERIARNVTDVMPNLTDKHHKQAAALFTQFSSAVSEDQPQSQQNGSKSEQNGGKHNGNKQWTCPVKGCKHVFSGKAVAMHKEKIKKAKANKGRRVAQLLCDFHLAELKKNGSVEYENGFVRNWHERKSKADANVAEAESDNKGNSQSSKSTGSNASSMEDAIKKAIDERLTQVASDLGSIIEDAGPEPEPEPAAAEESFAETLAKAIANRRK